ncbi:hypothetical protein OCJ37_14520 [Xanthomonas sp. AM6]|uniref:hypothetical protein n=1 Tax=Xanthomonas sp. AM6 TaxID=2982531 RepID=UPI0021DB2CF0|nr:hypothetical protein [Xanthomonas sp. AM6]UYB51200.1 hypothetical protein OCJ37_14520 [Xanthomonas sp. AM6]
MRVSATDIDAFRYYRDNEDAELEPLLAQLRRQMAPTEPMLAGRAFHKALELAPPGEVGVFEQDGYRFEIAADVEIDIPDVRELKSTRDYVIGGVPVTLVGMVDAIHGRRVDDHKTTTRFDPERFLDSYQWRIYLEVFGADEFRWNVFEWSNSEREPQTYVVRAVNPLTMYRYPGLAADVERELAEFVAFARQYLPERFALEEAA